MSADDAEFYVGYLPQSPPRLGRRTRRTVVALLLLAVAVAALLAVFQGDLRPSSFEYTVERSFRGVVSEHPYPTLRVMRPGVPAASAGGYSRYLLVGVGKHGAAEPVAGYDGRAVEIRGMLMYLDDCTGIEVRSVREIPAAELGSPQPAPGPELLGTFTLIGEIVDSKCHLGVMNPAERKTHRACATLCIRGGIPPILWVEDELGRARKLFLVSADGRAVNREVLPMVAERVEITGEVLRTDDVLILAADPATYHVLDG